MSTPGLLGVLGGMGPLATIDFLRKVLEATPAKTDQEHVPVLSSSIPQIPDRTTAFRGEGESPLPAMIENGKRLVDAGAGLIVMPCNTAHLWYEPLQTALGVPMLHLVDAALEDAIVLVGANGRLGLLATDGSIASGLYVNRRQPGGASIQWLLPTAREMIELVMPGIEAVKAGNEARGRELLSQAAAALGKRGAEAIVLGCTEIPVVLGSANAPVPVIDASDSLARRCVAWCQAERARTAH
ncbi:aspartate/glutamate racemase family protein [Alicycliphilus denitrificans]|uniref:Amino acid racemase n=2 Tax=Alicycliphilus denitrificans TaxID=179636 RepID=A0A420KEY9_9BURK|nr:amino acid racemase [Alicycliphilus denitrificans]RKJ98487.1 amino acid racemase [Alicycliphilus denitrificans]